MCSIDEISNPSVSATCKRNGEVSPCSGHLLPGTKATIKCQSGYQKPEGLVNTELTCQESGQWDLQAVKCVLH